MLLEQQRHGKDARSTSAREISGLIDVYNIKRQMGGSQKGYVSWHSPAGSPSRKTGPHIRVLQVRNHHASENEQGTSRIGDSTRIFSLVTIFDRRNRDGPRFHFLPGEDTLTALDRCPMCQASESKVRRAGRQLSAFTHD